MPAEVNSSVICALGAACHADGYGYFGTRSRKDLGARDRAERYFHGKPCVFFERFVDSADKARLKKIDGRGIERH